MRRASLPSCVTAAALAVAAMSALAARPKKFEPTFESLNTRQCPAWFPEARFGIFIHWGVYSVPAWSPKGSYAEWYWHHMRSGRYKGAVRKFHEKTYGKDFKYRDFAPKFRAELFEPGRWASLFQRSGAKYVVLTSKHHDGYCLWPAPDSKGWNSVDVGAKRDLCGDLAKAVRDAGLKMGFYYSLYEWYHPVYQKDVKKYVDEHMLPQIKDLVTRYSPAVIFADGEWSHPHTTWRSTEFLAWLYNEGPNPLEVVADDRWGKGMRSFCGDYYTTEYGHGGARAGQAAHAWEECRGIGASFGYNRNESVDNYATRTACVRMLIDAASRGGNLLLDVGPTADGRIPVIQQDRLMAMGKWLKVNGEAIYGTAAGPFGRSLPWGRATAKDDTLFLHVYDWPADGKLAVAGLANKVLGAHLLADPNKAPLPARRTGRAGWAIDLTGHYPRRHATVIVLKLDGKPIVDRRIYPSADGSVRLGAAAAKTHGKRLRLQSDPAGANLGYWTEVGDFASWELVIEKAGKYEVTLHYACKKGSTGSTFVVDAGGRKLECTIEKDTGTWEQFATVSLGEFTLEKPGPLELTVKPIRKAGEGVMNLKWLRLQPK